MDTKKKHICNINYDTLPYKLHYFLFCGAKGGILPYMVVFLKEKLNLSGATLATMVVVRCFMVVILKPSVGILVDYLNKLKLVMILLTVGEVIFYFLLLIMPRINRTPDVATILLENGQFLNGGYALAMYQKNESLFTIFIRSVEQRQLENNKNNNDTDAPFYVLLECDSNEGIDKTLSPEMITCYYKSSHLDKSFNPTVHDIDNPLLNPTICSTENTTCFHCFSQASLEAKDTTRLNEQNPTGSWERTIDNFNHQNISHQNTNLPQEQLLCSSLNETSYISDNGDEEFVIPLQYENILLVTILQLKTISVYSTYQYWLSALFWILSGLCSNSMFSLSDTACYECLQKTGKDYGRQRLWGAVSWGLISPATGFLNDFFTGDSKIPDYSPGFYVFGIVSIFEMWNLSRLDLVKQPRSSTFFKDFKRIFASKEFDVFVIAVFMIGFFTSFVWYYLMVYVESLGGSSLLMGLLNTSQCFIGEIPFMFYSGWLTKKLGHTQVLVVSFTFFALRFMLYYVIHNPWYLLPVESIHGLTYGLFYAAMTAFAKVSAVPGTEATTQSVLCATYEGLGVGIGSIVSGICSDRLGYRTMFMLASLSSLGCAICLYLVSKILKSRTKSLEIKLAL